MELEQWLAERTFHHSQFCDVAHLVDLKRTQGLTITLCLPTLNEQRTIGREIRVLKRALMDRQPLLDQILVAPKKRRAAAACAPGTEAAPAAQTAGRAAMKSPPRPTAAKARGDGGRA